MTKRFLGCFFVTLMIVVHQGLAMDQARHLTKAPQAGTLARAAFDGDSAGVQDFITAGAQLDLLDCNGKTPLQEAICQGHVDLAVKIIGFINNVSLLNAYSGEGCSALYYAIKKQQIVVVRNLLLKKVSLDFPIIKGNSKISALHIAVKTGNERLVKRLLATGAHADAQDAMGRTPLHYVAMVGDDASNYHEMVKLLLQYSPVILDNVDVDGATPLMCAIRNKSRPNIKFIEFLLSRGADVNKKSLRYSEKIEGITPFILAVIENYGEAVELLIKYGADINAQNKNGRKALDFAAINGFEKLQRLLILHGALWTVSADALRRHNAFCVLYPLHVAAEVGNLKYLKHYIIKGFMGCEFDQLHRNALHYACNSGDLASVKYLRGVMGVCDEDIDDHGKTPLHYAIEKGDYPVVEYLVCQKPSLLHGINGANCLEAAALCRQELLVSLLLRSGAQLANPLLWSVRQNLPSVVANLCANPQNAPLLSQQDARQKTPLHYTVERDDSTMTATLVRAGAPLVIQDEHGQTPFDYCVTKPVLRDCILQLTDISAIAAEHAAESQLDLQDKGRIVDLQDPRIAHLGLRGTIEHSLSQIREKSVSNAYCAYYALFNAKRNFEPPQRFYRPHFAAFFREALLTIKNHEGKPPYDNLTTHQLRLLIQTHCPSLPIAVIEMNSLNSYLMNVLNVVDSFEIKEGDRDLEVIRDFLAKRIDEIAVICGSGSIVGHWITVVAKRNADETVSIKLHDSLKSVGFWGQDLAGEILKSGVALIYLMLTNPEDQWKTVMNAQLLREIEKARSAGQMGADEPTKLLKAFENFIESLKAIQESLDVIMPRYQNHFPLSNAERIMLHLRLYAQSASAHQLWLCLNEKSGQTNFDDKKGSEILDLIALISVQKQQDFSARLTAWVDHPINCGVQYKQEIRDLANKTIALRNKLVTTEDSLTSGNFYDSTALPLHADKVAFIEKYLQANIKELITRIKKVPAGVSTLLFYGPPGNGKTTIAQAIAQLCPYKNAESKMVPRPFRIMRVPALGTKYQFSKTEQLNTLYAYIKENPHAVILLDEIDALADSKEDQDTAVQVVQKILDEAKGTSVIFIGTTNSDIELLSDGGGNKRLPPAFISRVENKIKIDNPELEHRAAIIANLRVATSEKTGTFIELSPADEQELARKTHGFSIRDLETMFSLAYQATFAHEDSEATVQARRITKEHFIKACEMVRKGKPNPYWGALTKCMNTFAAHGPAWISTVQNGFSMYLQEKRYRESMQKAEQHQNWQVGGAAVNLATVLVPLICPGAAPFVAVGAAMYNVASNLAQ